MWEGSRVSVGGPRVDQTRDAGRSLHDLIHEAVERERCEPSDFIRSGLRAARYSKPHARRSILGDVASILRCEPSELDFLFTAPCMAANDTNPVIMPDFRTRLDTVERLAAAE